MLYLSVGHGLDSAGRYDQGVQNPIDGATEHLLAFDVCKSAAEVLRAAGQDVTSEADGSPYDDPDQAGTLERANAADYTAVIDVHFDWWEDAPGLVCQYATSSGQDLAKAISAAWSEWRFPVRGIEHRPDLALLTESRAPAVVVICDRTRMIGEPELADYGRAIALAYADWRSADRSDAMLPVGVTFSAIAAGSLGDPERFESADAALAHAKRLLLDPHAPAQSVTVSQGRER